MARTVKVSYKPIAIGDMRFNTMKSAQDYFKLSSSYLIEKGLKEGKFNGMVCKYVQPTRRGKPIIAENPTKSKLGYEVVCEKTGEVYRSVADLYRFVKKMGMIKIPYSTFMHKLRDNKYAIIDNEKYILRSKLRTQNERIVYKDMDEVEEVPMQPQIITSENNIDVPVISHPTNPKELCIKQFLIDLVKERLVKHVDANEYSDAKAMLEVIEWVSNK